MSKRALVPNHMCIANAGVVTVQAGSQPCIPCDPHASPLTMVGQLSAAAQMAGSQARPA